MSPTNPHDMADEFGALEVQLRRIPPPEVPEGLLDRLMQDVPEPVPISSVRQRKRRSWQVPAAAVAAAALVALAIGIGTSPSAVRSDLSVSTDYVLFHPMELRHQETNPCCILPPLPES